jgi:uncharacterized membrane protein YccC
MLTSDRFAGVRFSINVAIATTIVWHVLWELGDANPLWAIASMIAASEPEPEEARRMFRCRLINVLVGSLVGLVFLLAAGVHMWVLPLALAVATAVSSYVIRIDTMWRQAPITAAVVIASGLMHDSARIGVGQGLHRVAEVIFGCVVGLVVSLAMSRVWRIRTGDAAQTSRMRAA